MCEIDQTTVNLLNQHLHLENLAQKNPAWTLGKSKFGDRGVFATRDITAGEIVFIDYPIVLGPRNTSDNICASCWRTISEFTQCANNCGLAACSTACCKSEKHKIACNQISKWKTIDICGDYTKYLLTSVKTLCVNDFQKDIIRCLAGYNEPQNIIELKVMKNDLALKLPENEEDWIRRVITVMNVNAFEVLIADDMPTARGLYVLSSLVNHSCAPNLMHVFNDKKQMIVKATRHIKEGEELFNTYVRLIWGTLSRRQYLMRTKNFACTCVRCADRCEFGTYMNAITCPRCGNNVLPINPLDNNSNWQCDNCQQLFTANRVRFIMSVIASRLEVISRDNVEELKRFYSGNVAKSIPETNQIVIQQKYLLIWILGHSKDYLLPDLSDELLALKEQNCIDILHIIEMLQLGQSKMRGLLLKELYLCRKERDMRAAKLDCNQNETLIKQIITTPEEDLKNDRYRDTLDESNKILKCDIFSV